jgi:hypothetical protein
MRHELIVAMAVIITGCGHLVAPQDYRIQPHQELSSPSTDKALVVFLWPNRKHGAATLAVMQNGAVVGALQGGTYFSRLIEPGPHQFSVDSGLMEKSREQVSLTAKPGQTYFMSYTPGGFYVVAKLDLISEDVALAQLPGLSTIQLTSR